jgi:2-dehydro-3-deoxygluconokinase
VRSGGQAIGCLGEGLVELSIARGSDDLLLGFGGDAANTAVMAARMGAPTRFYGRIGDDVLGQRLAAFWSASGVNLETITIERDAPTGLYVNELDLAGGHRFQYHRAGSSGSRYGTGDVDATSFDDLAVLHVTGIGVAVSPSLAAAVQAAVSRARREGITVSFGVNHRPGLRPDLNPLRALLALADIAFLSLEDAEALYGHRDQAALEGELARRGGGETVLTLGPAGAVAWVGGQRFACGAGPVEVIDTAGAGDALAGAYLASRLEGGDPLTALSVGVAAAGLSIGARGCALSYPTRESVQQAARRVEPAAAPELTAEGR